MRSCMNVRTEPVLTNVRSQMRLLFRALILLMTLSIFSCAVMPMKGRIASGRYYSPDGEFSIAIHEYWGPVQETVLPNQTFVDLAWQRDRATIGLFGYSTIEWLRLPQALSSEQFISISKSLAEEHVAKRFPSGSSFSVRETVSTLAGGNQALRFYATGKQEGRPTGWVGAVIHFGDRIAFVSHLDTRESLQNANPPSEETLRNWMQSLKLFEGVRRENKL